MSLVLRARGSVKERRKLTLPVTWKITTVIERNKSPCITGLQGYPKSLSTRSVGEFQRDGSTPSADLFIDLIYPTWDNDIRM
jgi:hypothetical protein